MTFEFFRGVFGEPNLEDGWAVRLGPSGPLKFLFLRDGLYAHLANPYPESYKIAMGGFATLGRENPSHHGV